MIAKILVALALVAFAVAQLVVSPTSLSSGNKVSKTLTRPADDTSAYVADSFTIYVPENSSFVNVTVSNTHVTGNGDCEYINYAVRVDGGVPCSENLFDSEDYFCSNGYETYVDYDDSVSDIWKTGFPDSPVLGQWAVGKNWTFAVYLEYASDYNAACTYDIIVTYGGSCTVGQVSVGSDDTLADDVCVTYMKGSNVTSNGTFVYQSAVTNAASNDFQVYQFVVPQATAWVQFNFTSTSTNAGLYGNSYAPGNYDDGWSYDCYEDGYYSMCDNSDSNCVYVYSLNCPTPRAGTFYVVVEDDTAYSANVTATTKVCNAGQGGVYCMSNDTSIGLSQSSMTTVTVSGVVTYDPNNAYVDYTFAYYHVDVPSQQNAQIIALTVSTTDTSSDLIAIIRLNAFPEDSEDFGYESDNLYATSFPHTWFINAQEYTNGGRYYLAIGCEDTTNAACAFTVMAAYNGTKVDNLTSGGSGSGSGSGTASGSGSSTTGTTTGAASSVVPAFLLIASIFVAIFNF